MPPIIGTAMRRITSEPVPVDHRIGSRPAMMATTVIIFGRTRSTAPIMIACVEIGAGHRLAFGGAPPLDLLPGVVEIDQHDDAGLGGDAGQRDEADGHGDAQVEAQRMTNHSPPTSENGRLSMTISVSVSRRKLR